MLAMLIGFMQVTGWLPLWTRDPGAGSAAVDSDAIYQGEAPVLVAHNGDKDWSLTKPDRIAVRGGDVFRLEADVRMEGKGRTGISVVERTGEEVRNWMSGYRPVSGVPWTHQVSNLIVPPGVDSIQPRLIGDGPGKTWVAHFSIVRLRHINALSVDTPAIMVDSSLLRVAVSPGTLGLQVTDRRTSKQWIQRTGALNLIPTKVEKIPGGVSVEGLSTADLTSVKTTFRIETAKPEVEVTLEGSGPLAEALECPQAFKSSHATEFVVPMNMGIAYKADDDAVAEQWLHSWGGHGLSMAFWGAQEGTSAMMTIIETPDDFMLRLVRRDGLLTAVPTWYGQKGQMGYARHLRYVFFDKGDYVAIAKRYRAYARQIGTLKTLKEKLAENPNVSKLVGAANWWTWDSNKKAFLDELKSAGLKNVLWSSDGDAALIDEINDAGYLSGRYDIYQDVMDPANFPKLSWVDADWTTAAWPNNLVRDAAGDWERGWVIKDKQGNDVPCGVCCDLVAPAYAEARISEDLRTRHFQARFIDTTTASPWRECYDPKHPMTRTDSRKAKMQLLELVSKRFSLVTGSETGQEAAVPYLHYFEGMMSLGPYRVKDAGTDPPKIYTDPPAYLLKFQLGPSYRLPLWQLVYGDCVVSYWYWGDFTNKVESQWDRRDQFCALYGVPPMYFTDLATLRANEARFVHSHNSVTEIAKAVGWSEMTNHRYLSPDRNVQESTWANGCRVIANFGDEVFVAPGGRRVEPGKWVFVRGTNRE